MSPCARAGGLTGGGGGGGPSHLIPLQQAAGGARFDPGVVCAVLPLHGGGGARPPPGGGGAQQAFSPESAAAVHVQVRVGWALRCIACLRGAPRRTLHVLLRASPPTPCSTLNQPAPALTLAQGAGHFVLLVCSRAVLACLLAPDGRLQVLHVFLPPHNTPADACPYAAWRMQQPQPAQQAQAQQQAGAVAATLAVAWQHSVSVYSATLLQRRPAPPPASGAVQQPTPPPAPLPPPALLRSWSVVGSDGGGAAANGGGGVCGCCFLDSGPLVR